jgi:hypothetical protein
VISPAPAARSCRALSWDRPQELLVYLIDADADLTAFADVIAAYRTVLDATANRALVYADPFGGGLDRLITAAYGLGVGLDHRALPESTRTTEHTSPI